MGRRCWGVGGRSRCEPSGLLTLPPPPTFTRGCAQMAAWLGPDVCDTCSGLVHEGTPALRCVNRHTEVGSWPACRVCYHPDCFRGTPDAYGPSQLSSKKFAKMGDAVRLHDVAIMEGRWVCDLCVVTSTVGHRFRHDYGRLLRLRSLERDRQLRILAAYADSTRQGHITGLNKVAAFESEFGVDLLPKAEAGLLASQDEIKTQWCILHSARKKVTRGRGDKKAERHIKFSGLESIRGALSAAQGAIAMHDASVPAVTQKPGGGGRQAGGGEGGGGPGSEMRRLFNKGTHSYMGSKVERPEVLPTAVVADIQLYSASGYRAAVRKGDHRLALQMASLCWYSGVMGMVGYRPGDIISSTREQWAKSAITVGGEQCHRIVLDASDMKGVHNDTDHVVVLPGESASLVVTRPGLWIMSASQRLGVSATAPMVSGISAGFNSSTMLQTLLRPALVAIRGNDEMKSSAKARDLDLDRVNVRSFRRSATKAMRKAGVDPELVRYIQQWKRRGGGSDMRLHYDEIDADDTVGAMQHI